MASSEVIIDRSYSFLDDEVDAHCVFDLILLNTEEINDLSDMNSSLFKRLWSRARLRCCADGGSNRLFDAVPGDALQTHSEEYLPTFICGDLDSIRPDVRQYYLSAGVPVVHSDCQDTTDLEKCMNALVIAHRASLQNISSARQAFSTRWNMSLSQAQAEFDSENSSTNFAASTVIIFGAFGGRFDHEIATIHAAFSNRDKFHRIILIGNRNLAEIFGGRCTVSLSSSHSCGDASNCVACERLILNRARMGRTCALIPMFGPAPCVHTTGFKWNLSGQELAFGRLVSTSNAFDSDCVTVTSAQPILFQSALM